MATNLSPRRAGVIGDPIEHSKSPDLHRAAYKELGFDCSYARYQVATGEGVQFYRSFTADPAATGLSVTMPQKAEFLAELDHRSERVERLGALNTVYRWIEPTGESIWCAENTDVDGIAKALAHAAGTLEAGPWLILGAGNTAAAAIAAAAEGGATAVNFVARNPQRATGSTELAARYGLDSTVYTPQQFTPELAREHVAVVSTLPAGAPDGWLADWQGGELMLPPLLDVAYEPWPSVLATGWAERGAPVVSGLEMLLYQAVEQIKLFAPSLWAQADQQGILDAMCDAVKLPRRKV